VANLDAREILEQVMRLAKPEVERKAKLVFAASSPVGHVRASTLLAHVFLNLVQNAAQAIPEGAPDRNEVRVHMAPQEGGVLVTVSDTGTGIAPEHLPRVFDPFFTTKPVGEGTGLGLALAQRIVQVSGGRLVARSDGKGATFEVWLPPASLPAR
jgi:signal transduction histidine kinase